MLVEVCRDDEVAAAHKLTEHYGIGVDTVADMKAQPPAFVWCQAAFLGMNERWKSGGP